MVTGRRLWGVVALCVLSGSGWMLTQGWPSEMGYPFAGCLHFALIGCVAALISVRRVGFRMPLGRAAVLGSAGVYLFVLPAMALHATAGVVSEASGVALFCSVPVMTVLHASYFGSDGSNPRGLLLPALVALGGALLVSPVELPGASVRGWIFFGLVVGCGVVVAVAGVWMHRLLQGVRIAAAVAVVGFSGAVVLGCHGLMLGWTVPSARVVGGELLRGAVFDLPAVWLSVWLMREVNPVRLSARFVLVPLVALFEGYAALRVWMDVKTTVEMAAMLGGAVVLLIKDEPEEIPGLRLR